MGGGEEAAAGAVAGRAGGRGEADKMTAIFGRNAEGRSPAENRSDRILC